MSNHRPTAVMTTLVALLVALLPAVGFAAEQLERLDDFGNADHRLDGTVWTMGRTVQGAVTNELRVIDAARVPRANPRLIMGARVQAVGAGDFVRFPSSAVDSVGAHGMQTLTSVRICDMNPGRAQARVLLTEFGIGPANTPPGNLANDVIAMLRIDCRAGGALEFSWQVFLCLDSPGNTVQSLGQGGLGPATTDQDDTLSLKTEDSSFAFAVDSGRTASFDVNSVLPGHTLRHPSVPIAPLGLRIDPHGAGDHEVVGTFDDVFILRR